MTNLNKFHSPYVVVLLTLLLFITKGNAKIEPDCVTPDSKLGSCIEVRYCVAIMTALVNHDHLTNPDVSKYLRESQCGLQLGSHKVCCNVNDIDLGDGTESSFIENTSQSAVIEPSTDINSQLSDMQTCGKLENNNESPLKWIGELWFKIETHGRTSSELKCLGTLISHKHLIVPAHCIANLPENITLDFVEIRGNEYTISKIYVHASYNKPPFANDIAIIELDKERDDELNDPICFPVEQQTFSDKRPSLAVLKRSSSALKFSKAQVISDNECRSIFDHRLTVQPGQYCAKISSNDTDFSPFIGSVILQSNKQRQYTLNGFTSEVIQPGQALDESKPYLFTEIVHYLNWIQAAIGDELKDKPKSSPLAPITQTGTRSCQTSSHDGFCVKQEKCSIFRDAPRPLSRQQEALLRQLKCYTSLEMEADLNQVIEDGICCPSKYVESNAKQDVSYLIDERFRGKRGADLIDMDKCGGSLDPSRRIVGGSKADLMEFPWIGVIKYKVGKLFKFTCGSSLISDKYVLTCAHCISSLPTGYQVTAVRFGEHDLSTDRDCKIVDEGVEKCNPPVQDIEVVKLIPHLQYNTPRYANDVGLIRLSSAPDMTKGIIPICLPLNDDLKQTITDKYTVAGFGFTESGRDSDVLMKAVMPKVSKESCQSQHQSVIQLSEGHSCYGGEGIIDACKGDSGNPLQNYVNIKGRIRAVQFGVVAAGHSECGRGAIGFPGIYSDVNYYLDWVLDNLEE